MANFKKTLYKSLVPKIFRRRIDKKRLKNEVLNYYDSLSKDELKPEEIEALDYLRNHEFCIFPYPFIENYSKADIEVFKEPNGMQYVIKDEKKLYFKRKSSARGIRRNYTELLKEQDPLSAHRYLTDEFEVSENSILVDVGAAEGVLPLDVIKKVKKAYLFETDERWLEAMQATFAPWSDKIEIINKFVSDKNDANHVSLDEFFKDKEAPDFIKIDAEGSEADILKGAKNLLESSDHLKVAICCYHKPNDAEEFEHFFNEREFETEFADGYMLFPEPKTYEPPYLRRGILRAIKSK